jgi:hypothetical protein
VCVCVCVAAVMHIVTKACAALSFSHGRAKIVDFRQMYGWGGFANERADL